MHQAGPGVLTVRTKGQAQIHATARLPRTTFASSVPAAVPMTFGARGAGLVVVELGELGSTRLPPVMEVELEVLRLGGSEGPAEAKVVDSIGIYCALPGSRTVLTSYAFTHPALPPTSALHSNCS
jgi:hypothetical protein